MTTTIASALDGAIAAFARAPEMLLESAVLLPPPTRDALAEAEHIVGSLPPWVRAMYTEVGGAHLSWRLRASGYSSRTRGNLDLLSLDELCHSITGRAGQGGSGWVPVLGELARGYWPVDFASYDLTMGFVAPGERDDAGLVLLDLVERRRVPLAMTLHDYVRTGAEMYFLDGWQVAVVDDTSGELRDLARRLSGG